MKNKLITLSLRKINKSKKRFLSLIILSVIGVSFFIGMKISMPNLLVSLDKYYKDNSVYDVEIISSNGLNKEDVESVSKMDDNLLVYGLHSKDVLVESDNLFSDVIRIKELNDNINTVNLLSGRMPINQNEILIDEKYLLNEGAKIGDELKLIVDEDDNDLTVSNLVIVGIINSPIYLTTDAGSINRGSTLIGNGEIKYYAYALGDIFNIDYYTELYIRNKNSFLDITNSVEYNKKTENIISKINDIKDERIKYRYEELRNIALNKIKKEEDKVMLEINNSWDKLNLVKKDIDNVKVELDNKKYELDNSYYELNNKKNEIDSADINIKKLENELVQKKYELDNAKNSIENYDILLEVAKKNQNDALTKEDIIKILPDDSDKEDTIGKLDLAEKFGLKFYNLTVIKEQIIQYNVDDGTFISKIDELEKSFDVVLQIEQGYILYDAKVSELSEYKKSLEDAKALYNYYLNEYSYGMSKYNEAVYQYEHELDRYNSARNELIEKENVARESFENARKEVDETITPGTWLIKNRLDNIDYRGFIDSIESLGRLSFIFPIIFFIVSIFISLLSMARMGIEDRNEMGTLKAFGFSKREILMQYVIYSGLATLIGSVVGVLLGILYFPKVIFEVYANLYAIPKMIYADYSKIVLIGLLITVLCIVGSTIISVMNILKSSTISLLRPIAPPIGKKILWEKFGLIWDKISFDNKVTLRNIFRYKKRILMTLTGIVTCTMILVSAFLIRDSITTVLDKQFNELFIYDSMIYLDGSKMSYELDDIFNKEHIDKVIYADLEKVEIDNTSIDLLIPNNIDDFEEVIKLRNKSGNLKIGNDGVIISSKLAKIFNIELDDIITVKMSNNVLREFKVNGITENYIGNYIYMSKEYYQNNIGVHELNIAFLKLDDKSNEENVVKDLLENNENILNYLSIKTNVSMVKNMFVSLDKVVLIVVIFSLMLSIVVLYSLAYIIISERQREIATLKVLGFDNEEVDMYLLKEQVIIISIGILLGLIIGVFYSLFLVDTLEISMVQFNKDLLFRNYIICIVLMLAFGNIVGDLIHLRLKKIDMIESLKSIE